MKDTQKSYFEFIGEFPRNTITGWGAELRSSLQWDCFGGATGLAGEPYRHWAAYPELVGPVAKVWDAVHGVIQEETGKVLSPDNIIANMFSHGDSSWLHTDSKSDTAWTAIIYLNWMWDINWGGETVLVEGDEILKSFAPTPGKIILFKSNILHGARPVSREAEFPRFGLTFQCELNDSNLQRLSQTSVAAVSSQKL